MKNRKKMSVTPQKAGQFPQTLHKTALRGRETGVVDHEVVVQLVQPCMATVEPKLSMAMKKKHVFFGCGKSCKKRHISHLPLIEALFGRVFPSRDGSSPESATRKRSANPVPRKIKFRCMPYRPTRQRATTQGASACGSAAKRESGKNTAYRIYTSRLRAPIP